MISFFFQGKHFTETAGEAGSPQRELVGRALVKELSLQCRCASVRVAPAAFH